MFGCRGLQSGSGRCTGCHNGSGGYMGPNGCTGCSFGNTQRKKSSTLGAKRKWHSYSHPSISAQQQLSSAFRTQSSHISTNRNSNSLSSDSVLTNSDPAKNVVQPSSSQYAFQTSTYPEQSSSLNSVATFSYPAHPYLTRSSSPSNTYYGQAPSNMAIDTMYLIGGYFSPQQSNRVEKYLNEVITFEEIMKEMNETYGGMLQNTPHSMKPDSIENSLKNSTDNVAPPPYIFKPVQLVTNDVNEVSSNSSSLLSKQDESIPLDSNSDDVKEYSSEIESSNKNSTEPDLSDEGSSENRSLEEKSSGRSLNTDNTEKDDLAEILRKKLKDIEEMSAKLMQRKKEVEEILKKLNIESENNALY